MLPINFESFLYWIREREQVRLRKESGARPPWSADKVFQTTYFTNVHREDDKVTKWIRAYYSPLVGDDWFEFNIVLSRFLNWPPTLDAIGYVNDKDYTYIRDIMNNIAKTGEKVWGGAYVITTHGIPMSKTDYLVDRVLPSAVNKIPRDYPNLKESAQSFMEIEGVSTFLAGQILADLKNTKGHLLEKAPDWWSFALPGPGSRRGMDWLYAERVPESRWSSCLHDLQSMLQLEGITLCAQDTQNCLCEYDKWCRVTLGTGRSKRKYYGT